MTDKDESYFDELDLSSIGSSMPTPAEYAEKMKKEEEARNLPSTVAKRYFIGEGNSIVRVVPFYSRQNKTWDKSRTIHVHQKVLRIEYEKNGKAKSFLRDISCDRKNYGTYCPVCELKDRLLSLQDQSEKNATWKFTDESADQFAYKNGITTTEKHLVNFMVLEDCGDKGQGNFERPDYSKGWVGHAVMFRSEFASLGALFSKSSYAGTWDPMTGSALEIEKKLEGKRRVTTFSLCPSHQKEPLHEDPEVVRDILKESEDLSAFFPPFLDTPDRDQQALDKHLITLKKEMLERMGVEDNPEQAGSADTGDNPDDDIPF